MKQNYSIVPEIIRNNPIHALRLSRSLLRQMKAQHIDYRLGRTVCNRISLLTLQITSQCNLRCVMCGQNGATGNLTRSSTAEPYELVPPDRYVRLAIEMAPHCPIVYVWGGEPLMYPGFLDVAADFRKHCPTLTVNTNGTLLAEHAERIVKDKWLALFVSLDAAEPINDGIRGRGAFNRAVQGIKAINREKKRRKSSLPYLGIVTTVSNRNYAHLYEFAMDARDYDIAWHVVNLGTYTNDLLGESHREVMRRTLGVDATYWRGFANGFNDGIDGRTFSETLRRVHSLRTRYPIITVPVIEPTHIGQYYASPQTLVRDHCSAPWFSANVRYDGAVHFCADYPDYVIGNIMDGPLMSIFNSDKAMKFRRTLRNAPNGVMPGCNRCYQLMLCGRRRRRIAGSTEVVSSETRSPPLDRKAG